MACNNAQTHQRLSLADTKCKNAHQRCNLTCSKCTKKLTNVLAYSTTTTTTTTHTHTHTHNSLKTWLAKSAQRNSSTTLLGFAASSQTPQKTQLGLQQVHKQGKHSPCSKYSNSRGSACCKSEHTHTHTHTHTKHKHIKDSNWLAASAQTPQKTPLCLDQVYTHIKN